MLEHHQRHDSAVTT